MPLRLNHRATRDGPLAGDPEILDSLVFDICQAVVMCEFGRYLVSSLAISSLFARRNPAMQLEPMAFRKSTIEHFRVKRVLEPETRGYGAIGPGDRPLPGNELLMPR
jgi:hypothetical protein